MEGGRKRIIRVAVRELIEAEEYQRLFKHIPKVTVEEEVVE